MTAIQYDSKNHENFEAVTRRLNDALAKMAKDSSIPANVAALARLANVHRNTIYQRKWPQEELKALKKKREHERKTLALTAAEFISPEERLEHSRLEILYWFTQLEDARLQNDDLRSTLILTAKARDKYKEDHSECLARLNQAKTDILRLENMVLLLQDELSRLADEGSSSG